MEPLMSLREALWGSALIAVCGFLVLAPIWNPSVAPRIYDRARALELWLLIAIGMLALFPAVRTAAADTWSRLGMAARAAVVIWLGGGALSALASDAPHMGVQQVALMLLLVWLAISVAGTTRALGRQADSALTAAFSLGAALVLVRFWSAFVQSVSQGREFSWVSPFLDFANIRFFGQYQAYVLLLVALPILAFRLPLSWRIVAGFAAAGFWMLEWIAGSRAVWAGAAAALAVVAVLMRKGRWRWLAIQGGLLLAGGLLFLVFDHFLLSTPNATPMPSHLSVAERGGESASIRVTLAQSALRLAAERPLAGTGPGQFGLYYDRTDAAHPHNAPLQLLAEYGLVAGTAGIAVGVLLVVFALRELRRRTRDEADMITASLCAALVMGVTDALFSGNLIMPHSQVALCVIAGWLLGRSAGAVVATRPAPWVRTGLAGVAILAAFVTAILMAEYLDVIRNMPYPPQLRVPSFWQYGRFTAW